MSKMLNVFLLQGMDAINEHAITFHYISPQQMHLLYYYTYHFRPFGISYTYS